MNGNMNIGGNNPTAMVDEKNNSKHASDSNEAHLAPIGQCLPINLVSDISLCDLFLLI